VGAPQTIPEGKLQFKCLFHLGASSGYDSAGFLLVLACRILVVSEKVRESPSISYLQALVVKHATYIHHVKLHTVEKRPM